MAQQSNLPRRVRRRLDEGDTSTSISSSRVADEVEALLGQSTMRAKYLSYITFDPDDPPRDIHPRRIQCIANWPKASRFVNAASPFVPSESWYRNGEFLWGYELPKLLLNNDGEGVDNDRLSQLCEVGRNARDAIRDYLMEVFKHTHGQLKEHEDFNKTWEVELVLCVPSNWSTYARLTLQEIMVDVVEETEMRGREFSIFIIDEPNAAVTFALRDEYIRENIEKGSNFVVCVAGGGTVEDCGSSFINEAFIKETRKRLAHIPTLGREPTEHELKRNYDPVDWDDQVSGNLRLYGLMEDPARDFGNGVFFITK
ncbi:hypothetical protein BDW75DRAFT_235055 [Aspergillus navahoensis]